MFQCRCPVSRWRVWIETTRDSTSREDRLLVPLPPKPPKEPRSKSLSSPMEMRRETRLDPLLDPSSRKVMRKKASFSPLSRWLNYMICIDAFRQNYIFYAVFSQIDDFIVHPKMEIVIYCIKIKNSTFFKISFCSTEERNSYGFGAS